MKADKLEQQFRDKLKEREINPSTDSWDRLNAMLTVAEEKKPKKIYGWIYIAASIIGFVLIGTVFLSQTEDLIDIRRNEVVIENKETVDPSVNKVDRVLPKQIQPVAVIPEVDKKLISKKTKIIAVKEADANHIASVDKPIVFNQIGSQPDQVKPAIVSVDEMLAAAQSSKNLDSKPSVKINANNLLSQVDGELELSFREKVINTAGTNLKTLKVAIASRNQNQKTE